jgi:hypothetical protein
VKIYLEVKIRQSIHLHTRRFAAVMKRNGDESLEQYLVSSCNVNLNNAEHHCASNIMRRPLFWPSRALLLCNNDISAIETYLVHKQGINRNKCSFPSFSTHREEVGSVASRRNIRQVALPNFPVVNVKHGSDMTKGNR